MKNVTIINETIEIDENGEYPIEADQSIIDQMKEQLSEPNIYKRNIPMINKYATMNERINSQEFFEQMKEFFIISNKQECESNDELFIVINNDYYQYIGVKND